MKTGYLLVLIVLGLCSCRKKDLKNISSYSCIYKVDSKGDQFYLKSDASCYCSGTHKEFQAYIGANNLKIVDQFAVPPLGGGGCNDSYLVEKNQSPLPATSNSSLNSVSIDLKMPPLPNVQMHTYNYNIGNLYYAILGGIIALMVILQTIFLIFFPKKSKK